MDDAGPLTLGEAPPVTVERPLAWVVSPHLLVAQAVTVALCSAGAHVQFHAWETVVLETRALSDPAPVQHVVAIVDGVDDPEVVAEIGRVVATGGVRVAVVDSAPLASWWGGLAAGGAVDVVPMAKTIRQLAEMVDRFTEGQLLMSADERAALYTAWAEALDKQHGVASLVASLSPRQLRVLELLASGHRVREVAQLLGVSDGTVRTHVKTLRHKIGARTQLEAVAMLHQVRQVRQVRDVGGSVAHLMPRPRQSPDGVADEHASIGFGP